MGQMKKNRIIVVVTNWNVVDYIRKSLDMIAVQDYDNFEVVVVDDCSDDGTWDIIQEYPFHLLRNKERNTSPMFNILQGINYLPKKDDDIIILTSGDDYLADEHVLSHLNECYQDDTWFTYGQYIPLGDLNAAQRCFPIPDTRTYRKSDQWLASHPITFRRWLWNRIKDKDLKNKDGNYSQYACDTSYIYALIEMAGKKHMKFIERVMYVYNDLNPACTYLIYSEQNLKEALFYKSKPIYKEIKKR